MSQRRSLPFLGRNFSYKRAQIIVHTMYLYKEPYGREV